MGAELEGEGFWAGVRTVQADWRTAAAMVQPALVEDQPRRLLAALAAGVPVIATPACGLDTRPGLTLVEADDAEALTAALRALVG
ncbi:MAG: glycosyltransferase [Proteobacteria bacterium]|nr:glycosyltransferase [Pseudomonadota bacterium]